MRELVKRFKRFFAFAALFSFVLNMLMLAPSVYMLQIFDRVVTGRSEETLAMLTIGVLPALVMMALLEIGRASCRERV